MDRTILSDQNCSEITLLRVIPTDSLGCSYPLHQPKDRIVVHVRQMPQTFVCFCQVYYQSIPTGTRALSDVSLQEFLEWQLNQFYPVLLSCYVSPHRSCFYRLSLNWSEKKTLSQSDTTYSRAVTIRDIWTKILPLRLKILKGTCKKEGKITYPQGVTPHGSNLLSGKNEICSIPSISFRTRHQIFRLVVGCR